MLLPLTFFSTMLPLSLVFFLLASRSCQSCHLLGPPDSSRRVRLKRLRKKKINEAGGRRTKSMLSQIYMHMCVYIWTDIERLNKFVDISINIFSELMHISICLLIDVSLLYLKQRFGHNMTPLGRKLECIWCTTNFNKFII